MPTEKLYYQDPFLQQFSAVVLSCEPLKTGYSIVLDRTVFYPEGGGQPRITSYNVCYTKLLRDLMVQFCTAYAGILSRHTLYATSYNFV